MKNVSMLLVTALLLLPMRGQAQIFGGIVYDPTNFHNAVLRYYQLGRQLAQMQQTYREIVSQYNLAVQMARGIQNMPARYKAYFSRWHTLSAQDMYNNTAPWVSAVNTGSPAAATAAYQQAAALLMPYNPATLNSINPYDAQRIKSQYATVELADGASSSAMATIGNIRADAQAVQNQITNLENDSFSTNPALNSEVGVLNKINATNVLILRSLQDANNLRLSALEQQLVQTKLDRDRAATSLDLNTEIHPGVQAPSPLTSGMSQAADNFQIP